jgi:hypothetical protein
VSTNTAPSRSAHSSIAGYLYQFYVSIEQILNTEDNAPITIEGIEDVDIQNNIQTELLQVKYHKDTDFCRSSIAKPIAYFYKHFIENPNSETTYKYKLYAYFNNPKEFNSFQLDEYFCGLKGFTDIVKTTIDANDLKTFNSLLSLELGEDIEQLKIKLINLFVEKLGITEEESSKHYLPNAVSFIHEIASKKDKTERQITLKEFRKEIDHKKPLFDLWFREIKGKEAYIKSIKSQLKNQNFYNNRRLSRFIFIKRSLITDNSRLSVQDLIYNVSLNYPLKGEICDTRIWTFILETDKEASQSIKTDLINRKVFFNDAYEDYSFSEDYFKNGYRALCQNRKEPRYVTNVNFEIRLIRLESFHDSLLDSNAFSIKTSDYTIYTLEELNQLLIHN